MTRYLRKRQVRDRYGWTAERSVDRAVADGRLPPPDIFQSRFPLWAERSLDRHDAKLAREHATRTIATA
jgi:hypothetical protein